MLQCPSVSYRHIFFSINLAVFRTYTRSPNGFPMDAQWTPNGRPNGRPMDAYEKWGFGDDGLEKRKCVECAYLFFKCTITKSPFFTGVHWASIGASIGRPLGVHWVSNIDALKCYSILVFLLILRMCNHVPWGGTVDGIIKMLFACLHFLVLCA